MPTQWPGQAAGSREFQPSPCADGSPPALEETMRRYAAMVFRICYAVTHNAHDAEDATQAAFLALHVQMKTGEPIRNVGGWLGQVGQRLALDLVRSKKRRRTRESAHGAISHIHVENADQSESKAIIAQELDKLPAKYRLPLILHYFGGMSHQEMAREMSCKPGTLRVRLCRAKEMLGHRLSARGMDLLGSALDLALEQIIHGGVTQSIVTAAKSATETIAHCRNGDSSLPPGMELWRSAGVTAKTKALVGASLLIATTVAAAMAQALGSVGANIGRHLPQELDAAIHAVTRPVLRSILPTLQARATQPSQGWTPPADSAHLALAPTKDDTYPPPAKISVSPVIDNGFHFSQVGVPHSVALSLASSTAPSIYSMGNAPDAQENGGMPHYGSSNFGNDASLPSIAGSAGQSAALASVPVKQPAPTLKIASTGVDPANKGMRPSLFADSGGNSKLIVATGTGSSIDTSNFTEMISGMPVESATSDLLVADGVTAELSGTSYVATMQSAFQKALLARPGPVVTTPTVHVVPEPGSLALIAGGFLLLRRRRRK